MSIPHLPNIIVQNYVDVALQDIGLVGMVVLG